MKQNARKIVENNQSVMNLSVASQLVQKWGTLLEGIKDGHTRKVMAQLYENESNYLKQQKLMETTTTDNTAPYVKYVFPLLRRVNVGVATA